jgi:hypothetical protein
MNTFKVTFSWNVTPGGVTKNSEVLAPTNCRSVCTTQHRVTRFTVVTLIRDVTGSKLSSDTYCTD